METKTNYFFSTCLIVVFLLFCVDSVAQDFTMTEGVYLSIPTENRLFKKLDKYPPYLKAKENYPYIKDVEKLFTKSELSYTLYSPTDDAEVHPLIIFMNGGGFISQDKDSRGMVMLGEHFASQGISLMVIDYRTQVLNLLSVTSAGYLALQDFHTAIKHAKSIAKDIKIDPDHIYVGGLSAGAISALHTAAMQKDEIEYVQFAEWDESYGCLDCEGPKNYNSEVRGVINIAGGILNLDILKDENFRLIQFVGVDDRIVPSTHGRPFVELITSDRNQNVFVNFFDSDLRTNFAEFITDFFDVPELHGSLNIDLNKRLFPNIEIETHSFPFHDHKLFMSDNGNRPMSTYYDIVEKITEFIKVDTHVEKPSIQLPPYAVAEKQMKLAGPKASKYRWTINGEPLPESTNPRLVYTFAEIGEAEVALSIQNKFGEWSEPSTQVIDVKAKSSFADKAADLSRNPWPYVFLIMALGGIIFAVANKKKSKRAFIILGLISTSTLSTLSAQSRPSLNSLEGEVYQLRIFLNDSLYTWSEEDKDQQIDYVDRANVWLQDKAYTYDDKLKFVTEEVDSIIYNPVIDADIFNSFSMIMGVEKSGFEKKYVPKQYRNNYHVVFISPKDGRSYAAHKHRWSADGVGHTVVFDSNRSSSQMPLVYAHEILHLYGANDFYTEDGERVKTFYKIKSLFPKEVMLSTFQPLDTAELCDYTAWLVGWEEEWEEWFGRVD
jgi:hypothetical protein